jgi:branched-chain amino acid aminotransferase
MVDTASISITRVAKSRLSKTNLDSLAFGKVFTDHMFMADYRDGQWKNLRIVPYGPIQISPATPALHYGQSIFEGMKAYRADDGGALVFRAVG